MKLTTRKDIEAPLDAVWEALSDFDHWERAAMRRGVEVHRAEPEVPGAPPPLSWTTLLVWRERQRRVDLKVVEQVPGQRLVVNGGGDTVEGRMEAELLEMGPHRTRILVSLTLSPLSLAARLFLQSARLVRGKLEERLDLRVAGFAEVVEARAGRRPRGAMQR